MAQLSLIGLVQEFCRRQGLVVPTVVFGNTDETVQQALGLLQESGEALAGEYDWKELHVRTTFNHGNKVDYVAYEYPIGLDLGSPTFRENVSMVPGTLWDSTNRRPVYGPVSDQEWNAMLAMNQSNAVYSFRLSGPTVPASLTVPNVIDAPSSMGGIQIYPVPTPLSSVLFTCEFLTSWYTAKYDGASGNVVPTPAFTSDTDYCLLDSTLMLAGLRWRWKKEKGLPYAEDKQTYDDMVMDAIGHENARGAVSMDGCHEYPRVVAPGLLIAAGNWDLP